MIMKFMKITVLSMIFKGMTNKNDRPSNFIIETNDPDNDSLENDGFKNDGYENESF